MPAVDAEIRAAGHNAFSSWYAAGATADDSWKEYEQGRGLSFRQALQDHAAQHVFEFDRKHLDSSDAAVLLLPAGKSGHLELGYMIGRGKPGWILSLDTKPEDERWDVMYQFATGICYSMEELIQCLSSLS